MLRLPIHGRTHLRADASLSTTDFVVCPDEHRWAPVEACRQCVKCAGVESGAVRCTPESTHMKSRPPEHTPITEVLDSDVLCIDADTTVYRARRAMTERGAPLAVVVDGGGHAIGVCSRLDLAQQRASCRVETCMTPFVITMLDSTSVADALELVLERDLHHVPVLSEGRVVGLVTPRAMIRWLAHALRAARNTRASLTAMPASLVRREQNDPHD